MASKDITKNMFNKIIGAAPRSLWMILAYICLTPLALSLSLNMAHIRVDDYANGLLKIALMKAEGNLISNQELEEAIKQITHRLEAVEEMAHESKDAKGE